MSNPIQSLIRLRSIIAKRLGITISSTSQKEALNTEINLALGDLHDRAPRAFDHSEEEIDVLQLVDFAANGIALKIPTGVPSIINDRVLEIRTDADAFLSSFFPIVDGTWDGRYWLRVRTSDGKSYDVQTREWWLSTIVTIDRYFVSLVDPCPFPAASIVTDVVAYQKHLWFPGDTRRVLPFPYTTEENREVRVDEIDATTAKAKLGQQNHIESRTGDITYMWRDRKFVMPDPVQTPAQHEGADAAWVGPFPKCKAEVRYTVRWGRRSSLVEGERPRGIYEPLWESAPSPLVEIDIQGVGNNSVVLESYNVDALLGFDHATLAGTPYQGRSGLRIAWWIRVTALNETGTMFDNMPTSERFYLLAEVEPTDTVTAGGATRYGAYEWTGADIPDFEVPLVPTVGYQGYGYSYFPSIDLALRAVAVRVPYELVHDYHTVKLKRSGMQAVIEYVFAVFARRRGRESEAVGAEGRYDVYVDRLLAAEGTPDGYIEPSTMADRPYNAPYKEIE